MYRLRMIQLVSRVTERAVRTWPLGEWALLRRVLPDGGSTNPDPRRFMPDKGSSLALDDLGFTPELDAIGEHFVSSTARFPVMSAAQNLVGAGQVQSATFQEHRTDVAGAGSLCRAALESSAKQSGYSPIQVAKCVVRGVVAIRFENGPIRNGSSAWKNRFWKGVLAANRPVPTRTSCVTVTSTTNYKKQSLACPRTR